MTLSMHGSNFNRFDSNKKCQRPYNELSCYQQCNIRVSCTPCVLFRRHLNRTQVNKNKVERDMALSFV